MTGRIVADNHINHITLEPGENLKAIKKSYSFEVLYLHKKRDAPNKWQEQRVSEKRKGVVPEKIKKFFASKKSSGVDFMN